MPPPRSLSPVLVRNLASAVAYLALGSLGLAFSSPHGYITPIFPAAGLALALVLRFGASALPGVWLGSFSLNLGLAWLNGTLSAGTATVALSISCGAMAQAWIGQRLIRQRIGEAWRKLDHERPVLCFLLLGGPLACLLSTTVGNASLLLAGIIDRPLLPFAWWNWFVGDTLGVLTFAPLSLCFLLPSGRLWQTRRRQVAIPMLLTLLFVGVAFYTTARWEHDGQQSRLEADGELIRQRIADRLLAHREALLSLRRLVELMPDINASQFDAFTLSTLEDNPDISALSFNAYVRDADRASFEQKMAASLGRPDFRISEQGEDGALRVAARRAAYVPVTYIVPRQPNLRAIGFDINSEPVRRDAVSRGTGLDGGIALTSPIHLVQENRTAVLALAPAHLPRAAHDGNAALHGFAVAVIKIGQLVDMANRAGLPPGLRLELSDPDSTSATRRLDDAGPAGATPATRAAWNSTLDIGDRTWALTIFADDRYTAFNRPWVAWGVGVVGLLFATLLQTLMLGMTGRTALVEAQVERQTADLAAKNRELTLATFSIENAIDAAYWMRPDGHIVRVNQAACDMLGYTRAELTALRVTDIDPHFNEARWEEHQALLAASGSEQLESVHRRKDGRELEVAISASNIHLDDETYIYASIRDITAHNLADAELKRHRDHLEELVAARTADLSVAKEAAEAANRAKSTFLANMSHELRTPMNAIIGLTHMLDRHNTDPGQKDRLDKISRAASHLLQLLDNVLELARIDAERLPLDETRFILPEVISHVTGLAADDLAAKGLSLGVDIDPRLQSMPLIGDPLRLQQVLVHIVDNAVKFTASGKVSLRARIGEENDDDALLCVEVQDNGIGIAPEARQRIFNPFEQADGSNTRQFGGTGVGLAICQRLVRLMGGDIGVNSIPGMGSTFWITFRAGKAAPEAAGTAPLSGTEAELQLRSHYRDRRILLAGDDWVSQEIIRELLRDAIGLETDLAVDGADAIRMARRSGYDLILMDMRMHDMDGIATARAIRSLASHGHTPIVAMTGNSRDDDLQACRDAGIDACIAKPVDPERLFVTLLDCLGAADRRQGGKPREPGARP